MSNTVKDAESFLFAIKTSTDFQFDGDAVEWLEGLEERMFALLDSRGIHGRERDRIILYDGMLKGVILKLRKPVVEAEKNLKEH
jgi:hypothetical protein